MTRVSVDDITGNLRANGPAFGGACPSNALDGRTEEAEGQQTSQPVHGTAVWLASLLSQMGCKTLVESGGLFGHAKRSRG